MLPQVGTTAEGATVTTSQDDDPNGGIVLNPNKCNF
jgi:hypothetical protein